MNEVRFAGILPELLMFAAAGGEVGIGGAELVVFIPLRISLMDGILARPDAPKP